MLWIRIDTGAIEIVSTDKAPEHGEWIEQCEAIRIIREHNERKTIEEQLAVGPGYDPTGEGSAWQPQNTQKSTESTPEPAPGSDAEHPPVGYRLVPPDSSDAIEHGWIVYAWGSGPWEPFTLGSIGRLRYDFKFACARPIPANEGDGRAEDAEDSRITHARVLASERDELRAELEATKRLLAESLVAQNRLETLRDALREALR